MKFYLFSFLLLGFFMEFSSSGRTNFSFRRQKQNRSARSRFRSPAPTNGRSGWGQWGYWNPCSKSCGGGLAVQTRTCYRQSSQTPQTCSGPYKRQRICNVMSCPGVPPDSPATRCQSYTAHLFPDKDYVWKQLPSDNPCDLNCRSSNLRFYYRHSTRVTDGMSCDGIEPELSSNNNRKVCVEGKCLSRGCDGFVGSGLLEDKCGVCGGRGDTCRYEEGEYRTDRLTTDYHLVVTVPAGAKRINITEKAKSKNTLALKEHRDGGRNLLNMGWRLNSEGSYMVPGSTAIYKHPMTDKGERILIEGPITEPLDVMLLFQGDNPGIHYSYLIPLSIPPVTSVELDGVKSNNRFDINGGHRNSLPGPQQGRIDIVRPPNTIYHRPQSSSGGSYPRRPYVPPYVPVANPNTHQRPPMDGTGSYNPSNNRPEINILNMEEEENIDSTNPRREALVVNIQKPRPYLNDGLNPNDVMAVETVLQSRPNDLEAKSNVLEVDLDEQDVSFDSPQVKWAISGFGPCTKKCAEGVQVTKIFCTSLESNETVPDAQCQNLPKPRMMMKKCNRFPCPAYYDVGNWSKCSQTCGLGRRSRRILCKQRFAGNFTTVVSHKRCRQRQKPRAHERCILQQCAKWIIDGGWSECSAKCGKGTQYRRAVCKASSNNVLPPQRCAGIRRPVLTQICSSVPCVTKWFQSEWETCSADCNSGTQKRDVRCVNTANREGGCTSSEPSATKSCTRPSCGERFEWFTGPWGACSVQCSSGIQSRKVTCLRVAADDTISTTDSTNCDSSTKPTTQQPCNTQVCGSRWYFTEWSECSQSCGGGDREREVWCLDNSGKISKVCKESEKPPMQERCNTDQCTVPVVDPKCRDYLSSCRMVHKAGLCSYTYYRRNCCHTCSQPMSSLRTPPGES